MLRRLLTLDVCIFLLGVVALILVGLLRSAFTTFPLVLFVSTLILFMVPGMVAVRWLFDGDISRAVMVPVSFALSAGIFGLSGVPLLMAHASFEFYLWFVSGILAASLLPAVFRALRRKHSAEDGNRIGFSTGWLWISFLLVSAVLAAVSRTSAPLPYDDIWIYLSWVREFLTTDKLALHEPYFGNSVGASRAQIDGWLLEQAALSRISGIDPVELLLRYLTPTLVIMSLLAVYALARILLKSEPAALLAGSMYALFILISLDLSQPLASGESFIGRIAEDKFTAGFLFLPVALIVAFLFLESHKLRYLMVFAFLCWAVVAIHPLGLALIGLCTTGFGLLHLGVNWREKAAWIGTVSLGGALLSILLAPLLYLLITGESLVAVLTSADLDYSDPQVETNMVFVRPDWQRVLELGNNYYMVHPAQLLDPAIPVAFLMGLPFLLWRVKRSLAAQLLAGMLVVPAIVCFVPPIATFIGNHIILPGQMWRLAWPIPLAAMLIVGWMVWETLRYAQIGLESSGGSRRLTMFLPLMLLCALMVAATPKSVDKVEAVYRAGRDVRSLGQCFDPIFHWMRDNLKEPSVVLAPDMESTCIPAYSANANTVSVRGGLILWLLPALESRAPGQIDVPQGALDVSTFFSPSTFAEQVRILRRYDVDYAMLPAGSPLNKTLERQPGFTVIDTPGAKYTLYAVDRSKLGE
jgi:hypothetical protein